AVGSTTVTATVSPGAVRPSGRSWMPTSSTLPLNAPTATAATAVAPQVARVARLGVRMTDLPRVLRVGGWGVAGDGRHDAQWVGPADRVGDRVGDTGSRAHRQQVP